MGNQPSVNVGGVVVRIKKQVAEGGFAFIYLAEDEQGRRYALKRVIVPFDDRERNASARKEQQMLQRIPPHQNIVKCVASGVQDGERDRSYYTVMEYCNGSVWNLMCDAVHSGQPLHEKLIMRVFRDAVLAIHHLHSLEPPIAHRDLKVENLLLGEDGLFKLCDFGSCTTQHKSFDGATTHEIVLAEEEINKNTTLAYRSPEQADLYQRKRISEKVDVWALGVLLYKLSCGRTPFEDPAGNVEKMGILNHRMRWPSDFRYSPAIQEFVAYMMNPDPEARPSAYDVLVWAQIAYVDGKLPHWPNTNVDGIVDVKSVQITEEHKSSATVGAQLSTQTAPDPMSTTQISQAFVNDAFFSQLSWQTDADTHHTHQISSPHEDDPLNPTMCESAEPQTRSYPVTSDNRRQAVSPKQISAPEESKTADIVRRASVVSSNIFHTARQIGGSVATILSMMAPDSEHAQWVQKATSSKGGFPKAKYVRKIVVGIWENDMDMAELLTLLVSRPWAKDPVVCVKALVVLTKVLQQGPPRVLGSCAQYIGFLSEMGQTWSHVLDNDRSTPSSAGREQPFGEDLIPMALYITKFTTLIQQKLHFHHAHPEYGHHFTTIVMMVGADTLPRDLQSDRMLSVLSRMLTIQQSLISVQRQAFSSCQSIKVDELNSTVTTSLLPLVEESYVLLVACTDLLLQLWSDCPVPGAALEAMKDQYNQQFSDLKQFYRHADSIPFIHTMDVLSLMNIPSTSPLEDLTSVSTENFTSNQVQRKHNMQVPIPHRFTAATNSKDAHNSFTKLVHLQAREHRQDSNDDDDEGYGFLPDVSQFATVLDSPPSSASKEKAFTPFAKGFDPFSTSGPAESAPKGTLSKSVSKETVSGNSKPRPPILKQPQVVVDLLEINTPSKDLRVDDFAFSNNAAPATLSMPKSSSPVLPTDNGYFGTNSRQQATPTPGHNAASYTSVGTRSPSGQNGVPVAVAAPITAPISATEDASAVAFGRAGVLTPPTDESSHLISDWSSTSTAESLLDMATVARGAAPHDAFKGVAASSFNPFGDTDEILQPQQLPAAAPRIPTTTLMPPSSEIDAVYNPSAQPWRQNLHVSLRPVFEECVRTFRSWGSEIDFSQFSVEKVIGTGAFAVVYKASFRGNKIAIKKLLSTAGAPVNAKTIIDFKNEADFMRQLRHPNIVSLMGTCTNPLSMVMEFCDKGALFGVLANKAEDLPMKRRLQIMTGLANGMHYLHSRRPMIIHRDLKSLNVLITADWQTKVTDFGLSRYTPNSVSEQMTGQIGTFHWMAPEVINSNYYTEKADVYSYGIIVWEIITRRTPYEGMQPVQVVAAVVNRNERPPIPESTDPLLRQLMQECWATAPTLRPSFAQVLTRLRSLVVD